MQLFKIPKNVTYVILYVHGDEVFYVVSDPELPKDWPHYETHN